MVREIINKEMISDEEMDYVISEYINEMKGQGKIVEIPFEGNIHRGNVRIVLHAAMFKIAFIYYWEKFTE